MLEIRDLKVLFPTGRGLVRAVDGIDLSVGPREIVGIVGESGSGKSVTLLSILRLIGRPGRIANGEIRFQGQSLLAKSPAAMREIRGRDIAMVFQDPMTTLNPVFRVGEQVRESLRVHGMISGNVRWPLTLFGDDRNRLRAERERVLALMREVGIPSPEMRYFDYPHQFSGGMQQRIMIAIALACEPKLLLADEPTTALDVTIQAQILDLLARINQEHGTGIILVTHNLGVAAEFTRRLAVMYAGSIVEDGPTDQIIANPRHPYTQGLLRSIPRISPQREKLAPIPGTVPDLIHMPEGCAFQPRCSQANPACQEAESLAFTNVAPGHRVRCRLYL